MKVRYTFSNDDTSYSYTDELEEDQPFEEGDWVAPFPNERGNSFAFGLWECLQQSDRCPAEFQQTPPNRIRTQYV